LVTILQDHHALAESMKAVEVQIRAIDT